MGQAWSKGLPCINSLTFTTSLSKRYHSYPYFIRKQTIFPKVSPGINGIAGIWSQQRRGTGEIEVAKKPEEK